MTTTVELDPEYRLWATEYMDPLNEVLFEMKDDGGTPVEIALFLVHRAVVEMIMGKVSRGQAQKILHEHLHYAVSAMYAYDGLDVEGTA